MSKKVELHDAPPQAGTLSKGRPPKWEWFFDTLRREPGKWAKMPKPYKGTSMSHAIQRGDVYGVKPGEFKAVSRSRKDGKTDIWVSYVGDQEGQTNE